MYPDQLIEYGESLIGTSLNISNIIFYLQSGYFEENANFKPLLHIWSISIEEQFYILFPLLLITLWKFREKTLFFVILLCFFLSFFLAYWGAYNYPTASFWLLPTRGWELLLGVLISIYLFRNNQFSNSLLFLDFSNFSFIKPNYFNSKISRVLYYRNWWTYWSLFSNR